MTQGADATVPPGAQFRRDLRDLLGREVARVELWAELTWAMPWRVKFFLRWITWSAKGHSDAGLDSLTRSHSLMDASWIRAR